MDLKEYGEFYNNYELTNYNTYKVKCICQYFIIVNSIIKLTNLVKYLTENELKYFLIGGGSNIILPSYYEGVIIKLDFNEIKIDKNSIEVGASYYLNKLALETVTLGLQGLEWAVGIPGTIGGSIAGNAGAYNDEIMNYLDKIEVLENNKIKVMRKSDIDYGYRTTMLKNKGVIILKAYLKLNKADKTKLLDLVSDRAQKRKDAQPLEYPSAGSVFRNPEEGFAGKLIEDAGLKGYMIGGAKVSDKHANFIINYDNATGEDIVNLINYVHDEVLKQYNIDLILEQQIIN